jgi:hypothetical protein
MWAHPTEENESGLWLTPTAVQINPRSPEMWPTPTQDSATERKKKYAQGGTPLTMAVKMWPTPATKGYGHASEGQYQNLYKKMMQGEITKEEMEVMTATKLENHRSYEKMQKMWPIPRKTIPTPTASDYIERESTSKEKLNPLTGKSVSLDRFVKFWPTKEDQASGIPKMWPTPTANEDAAGKPTGKMQRMLGNHPDVRNTGTGSLNPQWVEWLMGYPIGWTDLKD